MSAPGSQSVYGTTYGSAGYISLSTLYAAQEAGELHNYTVMVPPLNDPTKRGSFQGIGSVEEVGSKMCVRVTLYDGNSALMSIDSLIVSMREPRMSSFVKGNTVVPTAINPTLADSVVGKITNRIQSLESRMISSVEYVGSQMCYTLSVPWFILTGEITIFG